MRIRTRLCALALAAAILTAAGLRAARPAGAAPPPTAAQREKLKERDRFGAQAQAAYNAGRLDEALQATRRMLDVEMEVYGPAHEVVADTWRLLAMVYEKKESYADARKALRQAQRIRERLYGATDWRAVEGEWALHDLEVRAAMTPAQRREAARLQEEAASLSDRAMKLYGQGRYADAVPVLEQSLAKSRKLYPPERYPAGHPDLFQSLNNLAFLLDAGGESEKAEPIFRQALAMNRKLYPAGRYPAGHPSLAASLNNLGGLLDSRGELSRAEHFYSEALAMRRKLYPTDQYPAGHEDLAASLNNMASLLLARGEPGRAEPFFREALAICRKLYPPGRYPAGHPHLATSLSNLALLLKSRGEFTQAESVSREALAAFEKLYPPDKYPDGHPELAVVFANLGAILQSSDKLDEAERCYRKALAMRRKLYPPGQYPAGHPDVVNSLSSLGFVLQARGEFEQAEPFFRAALAMCRKLYPPERYTAGHSTLAESLNNLGAVLLARGDLEQAEPLLRDSLAMRRKVYPADGYPTGHPRLAESLYILGRLLYVRGQRSQAEPLSREALTMYQAIVRRVAALYGETEALNFVARAPLTRDLYLSITRELAPAPGVYEAVWQGKGLLMRVASRRHADLLANRDPRTRELGVELGDVRFQLSRMFARAPADAAERRRRLVELTERKESLERDIARHLPQSVDRTAGLQPSPDALRRLLPQRAVFIDFVRYMRFEYDPRRPGRKGETQTPCYVAFVLSRDRPAVRVELGPAAPIEQALSDWRRGIEQEREARPANADRRLGGLVWGPLVAHVPADTQVVYLCPDAELTRLPWACLPGRQAGRVLLEEYALAIVPHGGHLLEQLRARPSPPAADDLLLACGAVRYDRPPSTLREEPTGDLLVVNPERGGTSRLYWNYLGGTEQELRQVLALAGRRPVLVRQGSAASVAQLMRDLPRARWAHLATHGFFDDRGTRSVLQLAPEDYKRARWGERVGVGLRNPLLLSGLVLAGANRKGTDSDQPFDPDGGILTGEGLLALPLERLDLVVLSACETGLGDVAGGEGVFGLQRAFHVTGCKNVVASLWQVPDQSTAALMTVFYHELWEKGRSPIDALRHAQLHLYYHPDEIAALAQLRGPKRDLLDKVPDETKLPPGVKAVPGTPQPAGRAAVKQWAGFLLSGSGR